MSDIQGAKDRLRQMLAAKGLKPGAKPAPAPDPKANQLPIPDPEPAAQVAITPHTSVATKLEELQAALLGELPELPFVLKTIMSELKNDPDTVAVLSDEEIGLIVQGLKTHTNITITPAPKKSTSRKSQSVSLDMLK